MPAGERWRGGFLNDSVSTVNARDGAALSCITRGMVPPDDGDPR